MKKLLIVESPAKIKTISKFLGKDFKIMSTVGHIKDLPAKSLGVSFNKKKNTFEIDYVTMEDKSKVISDIVKTAQGCQEIFLAPDPDREGEIIAWHIGEEIAKVVKPEQIHRITFNEITEGAILDAISHPAQVDLQKVAAQQARRVLDRWVGYEVSPVLWRKVARGLSAGRVQSVALRLICDREEEIRKFKPEEYWSIDAEFNYQKSKFVATLALIDNKKFKLVNKEETTKLVVDLKAVNYQIDTIQDKNRIKNPVAPFETSSLQQAAYNQLGFSVQKTMQIAQKLYEGVPLTDPNSPVALITYMRTDSLRIADSALKQVREYIGNHLGDKYLPSSPNSYSKKSATATQDAHEAVRPIDVNFTPEQVNKYLQKDQAKLYELIWKRFVACQMKPAQYAQRTVTLVGGKYTFKVVGSTLLFDGFLKIYQDDEDEDQKVVKLPPNLVEKAAVDLNKVDPKQHFTQAPPRYTEASLVKEMKLVGIGRPSTYATILGTIQARSYTELDDKKRFVPTELGFAVTNLLVENLPKIMDTKFTAHMEEDLDKISQGELERDQLLSEFYNNFQEDLDKFAATDRPQSREIEMVCPECQSHNLAIKFGKGGEFLGCSNYPECKFTSNFTRTESGEVELKKTAEPILLDQICPQCNAKPLREMVGKYGKFISCSGYPECKYIQQEKADVKCTACQGELTKRRWSGGEFWGCANYPKCNFAVFGEILKKPCPDCKHPYLAQKQLKNSVAISCPVKGCKFKQKA